MSRRRRYKTCTLFFCDDEHYARGLCHRHYQKYYLRDKHHATDGDLARVVEMALTGDLPSNDEMRLFLREYTQFGF